MNELVEMLYNTMLRAAGELATRDIAMGRSVEEGLDQLRVSALFEGVMIDGPTFALCEQTYRQARANEGGSMDVIPPDN